MKTAHLAIAVASVGSFASAHADSVSVDIEVPVPVLETERDTAAIDESLDLANIVQSAAKGITTVQEAPAIVTVLTAEEIRSRQLQSLTQIYDSVPGWLDGDFWDGMMPGPLVRGQAQAVQLLHDGLSLFDPSGNLYSTWRVLPIELIKRVELITGPGGVLWGSNSLVGILNVITKDAEDIEGVDVGGSVGDGFGDRAMARAYVMAGSSELLGGKLKLFGHASFETFGGAGTRLPQVFFHATLPTPVGPNVYGPLTDSDQPRSTVYNFNGKLSYGALQIRAMYPFGQRRAPTSVSGAAVRQTLPEDTRCSPDVADPTCVDPLRTSRDNEINIFDRYVVADYRTRLGDSAGLTLRAYGNQFVRVFAPLNSLPASGSLGGGVAVSTDFSAYRTGGAFDGDVELTRKLRLLYGGEGFHEWSRVDTERSRQGEGSELTFDGPTNLGRLFFLCPRQYDPAAMAVVLQPNCPLTFAFAADRTVFGGYLSTQYRPTKSVILDLGGRVQAAPPSLGSVSYGVTPMVASSLVWNFVENWYAKLNYTQGFRPPVFNNTSGNGAAVNVAGNPNLDVETSDAAQVEINARIWKGDRQIRELFFRVDGSYTRINNLVQVISGAYKNTGERHVASGEFLGKLFVQGGHHLDLAYTYLRIDTDDVGRFRAIPEHWVDLSTVFQVIPDRMSATTRLRITGAAEDPNRLAEYRDLGYNEMGNPTGTRVVKASDLVLDRIPPQVELSVGVQFSPSKNLTIRAAAFNALAGHNHRPDVFYSLEPRAEYQPQPSDGFRAYASAEYQY